MISEFVQRIVQYLALRLGRKFYQLWKLIISLLEYLDILRVKKSIYIDNIYFMIHPACWQVYGSIPPREKSEKVKENWLKFLEKEKKVNRKQKSFFRKMKINDALIILPSDSCMAMLFLELQAKYQLGRRCYIIRRKFPVFPSSWRGETKIIQRFLDDPYLKGKKDFLYGIPLEIQKELEAELRGATKSINSEWNVAVLKVAFHSRLMAMDIKDAFKRNKIIFEESTVKSTAFGEGFEQCAMTWKQMLVPYLGMRFPAENNYELSMSPSNFLLDAELKEQIELYNDIVLYLWENGKGQEIGMYARSRCRLRDPAWYVNVQVSGYSFEVRQSTDVHLWPDGKTSRVHFSFENGYLRIPVYNGIRRDFDFHDISGSDEEACYLIAENISYEDFSTRLKNGRFVAEH